MGDVMIPQWTLGWRLQRALNHAGMQTDQMATELGVSRATVSRWLNDHGAAPKIAYLKVWALRCGVPLEWLLTGRDPSYASGQLMASDVRKPGSCPSDLGVAA